MTSFLINSLENMYRGAQNSYYEKFKLKICLFVLTIIIFSILYSFMDDEADWNITLIGEKMSLKNAYHFSVVTLATVGYGDIQPVSTRVRLLAHLEIFIGFAIAIL